MSLIESGQGKHRVLSLEKYLIFYAMNAIDEIIFLDVVVFGRKVLANIIK